MANDFSNDVDCIAVWRFESGALTTDSKGSNTLTDHNTVGTETSDYQEGAACADLEQSNSEYFSVIDSNLDSGFPLKSGDTVKKISICGWFKAESFPSNLGGMFGKYDDNDKRCFFVRCYNAFQLRIGTGTGSASELLHDAGTPATGRWYHVAFTFDNSNKSWKFVIWDDAASSKIINASGTATNNINAEDTPFAIGLDYYSSGTPANEWDGLIDEVVVFKDVLTAGEIDEIRTGTYQNDVDVAATTTSLTLTVYNANIWADLEVNTNPADLTLAAYQTMVGRSINVDVDTVALSATTIPVTIIDNVITVSCAVAPLSISVPFATVNYNVNALALVVPLTMTAYGATIWNGAAWTAWIAANGDKVSRLYYFTLTGAADGTTDVIIPISSWQARRKSGDPTFLSVVIPYLSTYQGYIEDRPNGTMKIAMAYEIAGVEQYRETVCQADLDESGDGSGVRIDKGGNSQSITLTGHKTESFTPKTIDLRDVIYESVAGGDCRYRCGSCDMYLNPGDTARYGSNEITVEQIVLIVGAESGGAVYESMDVEEAAT